MITLSLSTGQVVLADDVLSRRFGSLFGCGSTAVGTRMGRH
jgi:hypothetical protein